MVNNVGQRVPKPTMTSSNVLEAKDLQFVLMEEWVLKNYSTNLSIIKIVAD